MKDPRILYFQQKISTDPAWAERAILALYERQTTVEQATHTTREKNGRGFSAFHADYMTSLAKQLLKPGYHLTDKQLNSARKILRHYVGQLVQIADEKAKKLQSRAEILTYDSDDGWKLITDRGATWFSLTHGEWEIDFHGTRTVLKKDGKEMIAQSCSDMDTARDLSQLFKSFVSANEVV